jgi:hypothetical protein
VACKKGKIYLLFHNIPLERDISFHRGTFGKLEGGLFLRDRRMRALEKERLSMGALCGEPGERAPKRRNPRDIKCKSLETEVFFHRAP